jgi:hypothetical protein
MYKLPTRDFLMSENLGLKVKYNEILNKYLELLNSFKENKKEEPKKNKIELLKYPNVQKTMIDKINEMISFLNQL